MSYELKHTIEGKAKLVAFNPQDNTSFLSVSQIKKSQWIDEDIVYLWKEVDKRWDRVKEFKPNMVIDKLSFSPDGNKFVNTSDSSNYTFEVWNINTGVKESYNAAEDTIYSELGEEIDEDWLDNHQPLIFNTFFVTDTNLLSAETSDEMCNSPPPVFTVFREFATTTGSSQYSSLNNLFNDTTASDEALTLVNKSIKKLKTDGFFASPSREFFATTHVDNEKRKGYVWIRNNVGNAELKFTDNDTSEISYVAFNPTNKYQYATGGPNYVKLWGHTKEKIINTGILKHIYEGEYDYNSDKYIKSIAWSPDGKTIAFINKNPVVIIYRINKKGFWEIYKTIETNAKPNQVCFDYTGIQLAVVTDAYIQIWYDMEKIQKYFDNTGTEIPFDVVGNIVGYTGDVPFGAIENQRGLEYGTSEQAKLKQIRDILTSIPIDLALAALTNTSKGGRTRRNRKKRKSVTPSRIENARGKVTFR
jgi:WD40 repeat protein